MKTELGDKSDRSVTCYMFHRRAFMGLYGQVCFKSTLEKPIPV